MRVSHKETENLAAGHMLGVGWKELEIRVSIKTTGKECRQPQRSLPESSSIRPLKALATQYLPGLFLQGSSPPPTLKATYFSIAAVLIVSARLHPPKKQQMGQPADDETTSPPLPKFSSNQTLLGSKNQSSLPLLSISHPKQTQHNPSFLIS